MPNVRKTLVFEISLSLSRVYDPNHLLFNWNKHTRRARHNIARVLLLL